MKLGFALDGDDYAALHESGGVDAIVACDPDVAFSLRDCRDAPRLFSPWDFVDAGARAASRRLLDEALDHWRRHSTIALDGVDLLAIAGFRHVGWVSRFVWCDTIARTALAALCPREVVLVAIPPVHGLMREPANRRFPLLQSFARCHAERLGMHVTWAAARDAAEAPSKIDTCDTGDAGDARRIDPGAELRGRRYALLYATGGDLLRQRIVAEHLDPPGLLRVHVHKQARPEHVQGMRGCCDHVWHESRLDCPIAEHDLDRVSLAAARQRELLHDCPTSLRSLFANEHLDTHYRFLFGEYAAAMARHVRRWHALFDAAEPSIVVAHYQASVLDVAALRGVPALALPHGSNMGFEPWYRTFPRGCTVGVISRTQKRLLIRSGMDRRSLIVTGDPGLDAARSAPVVACMDRPQRRPCVLVCSSHFGLLSKLDELPPCDWRVALRVVEELAALAARRNEWCFVFKCHPRFDHPEIYAALASAHVQIETTAPIAPLIADADVVVFPGVISSTMVEAGLAGKAVYLLTAPLVDFSPERWGLRDWPMVPDVRALDAELSSVLGSQEARATAVLRTQAGLAHYLDGAPANASRRCGNLIRRLARRGPLDHAADAARRSALQRRAAIPAQLEVSGR